MHLRFIEVIKAVIKCSQHKFYLLSPVNTAKQIKYWAHVNTHNVIYRKNILTNLIFFIFTLPLFPSWRLFSVANDSVAI